LDIIKTHPVVGEVIASGFGMSQEEVSMIKYHHERWDGSGYPEGLSGEDIPYLARILAVADSYDAMTSHRPYKDVLSPVKAEYELRDQSGWQFDSDIVAAFITGGIQSYLQGERFVEVRF
jgi:HD-GYP domain-containing protein (c-di-GMP phosphodiesterase class II)